MRTISLMQEDEHLKWLMRAVKALTVLSGLASIACGVVGIYEGLQVLKTWPPLTWNLLVSGIIIL